MAFESTEHWIWDFWFADDGDRYHLYYLHAPRSLHDPGLRHRNARIGHATSHDLSEWIDHGQIFNSGEIGDFDETATWTGNVVRGADRLWRMFYTGARFLSEDAFVNVETIGMATSLDLHEWTKQPGPLVTADARWYETLEHETWREEACRDPWVFPTAGGWGMLYTARAIGSRADGDDTGVIGYATSSDLIEWNVEPPRSRAGSGFMHLEVPQLVEIEGRTVLLFSCPTDHLAGHRTGPDQRGGVWAADVNADGTYSIEDAYLLAAEPHYGGRAVQARDGRWFLLTFDNQERGSHFRGGISDPKLLKWRSNGQLTV